MSRTTMITLAVAFGAVGACQKESAPSATTPGDAQGPAWLVASLPDQAVPVAQLKQSAKEGDTVAIRGRIGGSVKPLAPGSGVFVIVDAIIPSCAEMGDDDHCPTPWDYCCEPRDSLNASSATIMLVDASGAPLSADLEAAGLHPLDDVVAVGVVGPRPAPEVLTIKATKLHRVGG